MPKKLITMYQIKQKLNNIFVNIKISVPLLGRLFFINSINYRRNNLTNKTKAINREKANNNTEISTILLDIISVCEDQIIAVAIILEANNMVRIRLIILDFIS